MFRAPCEITRRSSDARLLVTVCALVLVAEIEFRNGCGVAHGNVQNAEPCSDDSLFQLAKRTACRENCADFRKKCCLRRETE
jgi:hypothetical protein